MSKSLVIGLRTPLDEVARLDELLAPALSQQLEEVASGQRAAPEINRARVARLAFLRGLPLLESELLAGPKGAGR